MKITKQVEVFNANAFVEDKLYYLDENFCSRRYQGVYICEEVDIEENIVKLKEIVDLNGYNLTPHIEINCRNYKDIIEVQPIEFDIDFDKEFKEWRACLYINIEEDME